MAKNKLTTEILRPDYDGTVVFSIGEILTGGSKKTVEFARKHGRPVLHLSKTTSGLSGAEASLRRFVEKHGIRVLNVAGPRASKEPEVASFVKEVLDRTWPSRIDTIRYRLKIASRLKTRAVGKKCG